MQSQNFNTLPQYPCIFVGEIAIYGMNSHKRARFCLGNVDLIMDAAKGVEDEFRFLSILHGIPFVTGCVLIITFQQRFSSFFR